jgi:hypothetical protein
LHFETFVKRPTRFQNADDDRDRRRVRRRRDDGWLLDDLRVE